MTPDFWHQAEQLFHAALQRVPAERAAFVAGACAGDRVLQEHVERLLEQDDLADREGFLAPPELGDVSTPSPQADVTLLGRRLGPYEVRAEIGRGGMGTVYRAERVADYRQQVAVKVIKAGLADEHAPRFHRERQVLAELEHPHIARLLDGGTADGLPYLVMECIDGRPLHRYCEEQRLTTRQRLELLLPVCRAVQYAHERGVIHRDLKPGNVLVTADGTPKVTDFGLAKRLSAAAGGADGDPLTHSGAIVGTPSYMAPEQADERPQEVGPAADVYALGAILYELLTGRPPFRGETTWEVLRQVHTAEPVAPSRLQPGLARDVETICLKCLEKEPARRYASARALAEDLEHFLAGKPIRARPVGNIGRAWRWCRRRPAVAALAASLLVNTAVVIGGVVWLWQRAEAERTQAEAERTQVKLQRDETRRSSADLARTLFNLAHTLEKEKTAAAEKHYQRAIALMEGLSGEAPDVLAYRRELAAFYYQLGLGYKRTDRLEDARTLLSQALQTWEELLRDFPHQPDHVNDLGTTRDALGDLYRLTGNLDKAEEEWRKAAALYAKAAGAAPANRTFTANHGRVLFNLALMATERKRHEQVIPLLTEAVASLEAVSHLPGQNWFIGNSYALRAETKDQFGHYAEALSDWDRAIKFASGDEQSEFRMLRAQTVAALGQHADAVAGAVKVLADGTKSGGQFDRQAVVFARAAQAARKDTALPEADRAALAERYTLAGVAALRKAHEAGYYDDTARSRKLREDPAYEPLRSRPEFRELLRELKRNGS